MIGDVFHSAAANETPDVKRWGLNVDYCPAFITEEEIERASLQSTILKMHWTVSTTICLLLVIVEHVSVSTWCNVW